MGANSSNKKIAKNTLFMYFRMALITVVGLYTSRVILNALGVEDYGIYHVAGSVVAMFGFLNSALANSSSRFLTVELGKTGKGKIEQLTRCFTTTRGIHGLLAIGIFIIAETVGLWFLNTQCEIPETRMEAAGWVYQISIITAVLTITLVPYNALIVAHEHMNVYAYIGILDSFLKLGICYLIKHSPFDKLIYYALLLFCIQILNNLFNRIYCKKHFAECSLKYSLDKHFFKPILGFTGWNLLGSFSTMTLAQGATLMVSAFFGPAVVTARAIASQLRNHLFRFINSFRTAVNPQIIKRDASGDVKGSTDLLFFSTKITFYLTLVIILPFLFETEFLLKIWLKNVPEYAVAFVRLSLLEILFFVYDISFYTLFQAKGRLKENALISPLLDIVAFVSVAIIYMMGGSLLAIGWAMLILSFVHGVVVKPFLAVRLFKCRWGDFIQTFSRTLCVFIVSSIIPVILYNSLDESVNNRIIVIIASILCAPASSYLFGLTLKEKNILKEMITQLYRRLCNKR